MTKLLQSRPAHDVVCVLYSHDTGKIVFAHHFTFLGKTPHPSDQQLEKQTRQALKDHNQHSGDQQTTHENLAALILPSEKFLPGHTFSIDPKKATLLTHPRSPRTE